VSDGTGSPNHADLEGLAGLTRSHGLSQCHEQGDLGKH